MTKLPDLPYPLDPITLSAVEIMKQRNSSVSQTSGKRRGKDVKGYLFKLPSIKIGTYHFPTEVRIFMRKGHTLSADIIFRKKKGKEYKYRLTYAEREVRISIFKDIVPKVILQFPDSKIKKAQISNLVVNTLGVPVFITADFMLSFFTNPDIIKRESVQKMLLLIRKIKDAESASFSGETIEKITLAICKTQPEISAIFTENFTPFDFITSAGDPGNILLSLFIGGIPLEALQELEVSQG